MKLSELIEKLNQAYGFDLSEQDKKRIHANCRLANVPSDNISPDQMSQNIDMVLSTVQSHIHYRGKFNPTFQGKRKTVTAQTQQDVCPECKNKMESVELLNVPNAVYCKAHQICLPLPVSE